MHGTGVLSCESLRFLSLEHSTDSRRFCECEARYIKADPTGEGYLVFFAWHGGKRGKFGDDVYDHLMWVKARKLVFVGAGSLGTTEIMLRSKQMGLSMNDHVGQGMSGNGDILAFG